MYEMYEDNNYLAHYGVKGMKWGVRRAKDPVLGEKKAAYKQAKKDYNKSYSEAYKYSSRHPVGQWASKKKSAEAGRRWEDAIDKAGKLNTAKSEYKQAKKDARNTPEAKAARKKALKVGAAVAGTALAAYGAYKLNKYVNSTHGKIQAKRGYEAAERFFSQSLDATANRVLPKGATATYTLNSNSGNAAAKAARAASKDNFRTAARNVIDYRKQNGSRSLRDLGSVAYYTNNPGSSITFTRRG